MIAPLNISLLGFSIVFHDKAKRTQQENLVDLDDEVDHPTIQPTEE